MTCIARTKRNRSLTKLTRTARTARVSATANKNLHYFTHVIGASLGSERSKNAIMIGDCDTTNLRANTVVLLYAMKFRNAFEMQCTSDGKALNYEKAEEDDFGEGDKDTPPKDHNVESWFVWMADKNFHVPSYYVDIT
jgi:hypothetical protein